MAATEIIDLAKLATLSFSASFRIRAMNWGIRQIFHGDVLAHGLGTMNEIAAEQTLDSTYLMLGIELGLVGLGLFVALVFLTIRRGWRLVAAFRNNGNIPAAELTTVSTGVFAALAVHGLFETYLLVGIQLGTLMFYAAAAQIHALPFPATHSIPRGEPGPADRP